MLTAGGESVLSEALSEPHPEVAASSGGSNDAAAAAAAANAARQLRGRMALLKQKLGEENEVRADLLQEEHNQRLQLMTGSPRPLLQQERLQFPQPCRWK